MPVILMFLSLNATTKHQFTEMTLERKYLLLFQLLGDLIVFISTLDLILQLLAVVEFVISMYLFIINVGWTIIAIIETISDPSFQSVLPIIFKIFKEPYFFKQIRVSYIWPILAGWDKNFWLAFQSDCILTRIGIWPQLYFSRTWRMIIWVLTSWFWLTLDCILLFFSSLV